MTSTLQQYYSILGVNATTRLPQVKAAYRRKAKVLHPDVNKAADASEKFILLNQAYEYFESTLGEKKFYETKVPVTARPRRKPEETAKQKKEEAFKRAERSAQLKDELFRRSKFYWGIVGLHALMDYMILAGVLALYLIVLVFGTLYQGTPGLIAGIISVLITLPHVVFGIRNFRKQKVR
jgi:hypothetical protein